MKLFLNILVLLVTVNIATNIYASTDLDMDVIVDENTIPNRHKMVSTSWRDSPPGFRYESVSYSEGDSFDIPDMSKSILSNGDFNNGADDWVIHENYEIITEFEDYPESEGNKVLHIKFDNTPLVEGPDGVLRGIIRVIGLYKNQLEQKIKITDNFTGYYNFYMKAKLGNINDEYKSSEFKVYLEWRSSDGLLRTKTIVNLFIDNNEYTQIRQRINFNFLSDSAYDLTIKFDNAHANFFSYDIILVKEDEYSTGNVWIQLDEKYIVSAYPPVLA